MAYTRSARGTTDNTYTRNRSYLWRPERTLSCYAWLPLKTITYTPNKSHSSTELFDRVPPAQPDCCTLMSGFFV